MNNLVHDSQTKNDAITYKTHRRVGCEISSSTLTSLAKFNVTLEQVLQIILMEMSMNE